MELFVYQSRYTLYFCSMSSIQAALDGRKASPWGLLLHINHVFSINCDVYTLLSPFFHLFIGLIRIATKLIESNRVNKWSIDQLRFSFVLHLDATKRPDTVDRLPGSPPSLVNYKKIKYLRDRVDHVQSHLHATAGVIRARLRQTRHAVVTIAENFNS